jgi:acetyl-CoA acyltransferase 1
MDRIEHLKSHLSINPTTAKLSQTKVFGKVGVKSPNDVVIVSALRTAICKAKKGAFKDTTPDDLLVPVLQAVVKESKVPAEMLGDIVIGNVGTYGAYALPARTAQLRAGIPYETTLKTVNRQCSSGLQAVSDIATAIASGLIDAGIGGGVESMSFSGPPGDPSTVPPFNMSATFDVQSAANCLQPMGETSENVAEKYGLTREAQDAFAVRSHAKAAQAIKSKAFDGEIVPITAVVKDAEGNEKEVTVTQDEGPRGDTNLEGLKKLKAAFKKGGSTTAGNASQVSDGAAAVVLIRRSEAERLGLKVLAVFRGYKVSGVPPDVMGIGPAVAIPELLKDVGLTVNDIDLFELNEAFASQALYCLQSIGIPESKVNLNGGAIALGHPLGCTGSNIDMISSSSSSCSSSSSLSSFTNASSSLNGFLLIDNSLATNFTCLFDDFLTFLCSLIPRTMED